MNSFSLIIYKTPYPWFSLHNFCVSTFLILVAWGQVSLIGWQFVMLRRCLMISLSLLWFVAVSTISLICLDKVSPYSIQMLCNTIHARVLSRTSSCPLSRFLWRTRHLPVIIVLLWWGQHSTSIRFHQPALKWEGRITQNYWRDINTFKIFSYIR